MGTREPRGWRLCIVLVLLLRAVLGLARRSLVQALRGGTLTACAGGLRSCLCQGAILVSTKGFSGVPEEGLGYEPRLPLWAALWYVASKP